MSQKPTNMGIAGVEPCQLAPTVGMKGSGSTDSLAPSPTNAKIDNDTTIDTVVGIAVSAIIDINPSGPEVDIAGSTAIGTASPSTTGLTPAMTIIDPTSGTAGAISMVTGGFDMAFGLFNFRVDNDGAMELISISDSAPPTAETSTPPAVRGKPRQSHHWRHWRRNQS
jgi:hypothetical protein